MSDVICSMIPGGAAPEFELLYELKSSGGTSVYVLYDRVCRRKLVMKTGDRFVIENEAAMLERFAGNGIPTVYGCYPAGDKACLCRQYIDGKSLREILDEQGSLSVKNTLNIGVEVCGILERLHSCNPPVIHRDIKTDNIVLTPDGDIYIIDFGIAREYDTSADRDTHVLGTPITAPPEQFGYTQTDERSDIYAVGVMLNELATGDVKIETSGLPNGLRKIIRRCTEFSPDERYKDASELGSALKRLVRPKKIPSIIAAACVALAALVFIAAGINKIVPEIFEEPIKGAVFSEDGSYIFIDSAIEAEVRNILMKPTESITQDDLDSITGIMLVGNTHANLWGDIIIHGSVIDVDGIEISAIGDVERLDDLRYMPNLKTVILCNQRISDISPLDGLNIKELALHGNEINDISPLSSCRFLERLFISSNPISDITPLETLSRLETLNIGATEIDSFESIKKLTALTRLEIHDCPKLTDFSPLDGMHSLNFLSLRPVPKEALESISELVGLDSLYLWKAYDLKSLTQLSHLTNLRNLGLDACGLESLDGIKNFSHLYYITIRYCVVDDLSPLSGITTLGRVGITSNPISDFSPLSELPLLNTVWCSKNMEPYVRETVGENVTIIIE